MTDTPRPEDEGLVLPEWVRLVTPRVLEQLVGPPTFQRGVTYQRRRAVHDLRVGPDGRALSASVLGTVPYRTTVRPESRTGDGLPSSPDDLDVDCRCSCPVQVDCKHAVAVLLEARAQLGVASTAAPSWERLLAPVVQAVREDGAGDSDTTPLALHVDLVPGEDSPQQGHLRDPRVQLRPLARGTTGWVRSGVGWADLQFAHHWRHFDPAQRDALVALAQAERTRTAGQWSATQVVSAQVLGPSLWRLLDDVVAAGVPLVTGPRSREPVVLADEPVEVRIDLVRDADGTLVLRPSLDLAPLGDAVGPPELFGTPPHGVAVRTPDGLALAPLGRALTGPLADVFRAGEELTVPGDDEPRFWTGFYPALRQLVELGSSDGSVTPPEVEPPQLALRVLFEPGHRTALAWSFRYRVGSGVADVPLSRHPVGPGVGQGGGPDGEHGVVRDAGEEERLLAALGPDLAPVPGLVRRLPGRPRPEVVPAPVLEGAATVDFVDLVLPVLQERKDVEVEVEGSALEYVEAEGDAVVELATDDHGQEDWFDLEITVSVGERRLPLADLLTALALGEERLILPDGTWFRLDAPELHELARLVEEARRLHDQEGEGLRVNRFQAGYWEELVALGVVTRQSERWQRSVGALLALDEVPRPDPPPTLTATLREYQLDGYRWLSFLWDHRLGGVLADDMGLGKTLQTLATLERARLAGSLTPGAPVLVVAPTSVVAVWEHEAAKFAPGLRVATVGRTSRSGGGPGDDALAGAHVVVTSYALLRIDGDEYAARPWAALVLDEAQAVKNRKAKTYQVARRIEASVKIAITGTPLENSLMDLWSLMSIVAPGLFPSPERFAEVFRRPIESGRAPELLPVLRRRIRPLMLRRTKESVARDLPPKVEQVLAVPLNAQHRRIYDTHLQRERQRILGLLDDVDGNRIAILAALTRLRQLSLDVHLVDHDAPPGVRSSKVDALLEQLVEVVAEGHRCLVFSQFTRFLATVRERLAAEGLDHVYLDGRTRDRAARVAEFTEGDAPVFLISLKAGGSGLTLTEADYVFVLDPWWNPAVEAQAVDRTHRIGQDKTVMVYRLVSEGTVEEKVVELQQRKRDLFDRVVDQGGAIAAPLSADDIRGLLDG
ncbi:DEAD/DEAH box helicase [Nocardioides solisilvae]|uniref:DEAD/DEAH box helicase n=1 Tax=Nocardioides solisilvae TaxID=1542435 RepID=UPI000D744BB9|nr:DEAD/DEAH box helicase [Nocardioides solisilvae]